MSYKNTVNNETWTMRACYTTSISCALWLASYVLEWSLASVIFLTVCAVSFFFLWFSEDMDATKAKNNLNDNLWTKYKVIPASLVDAAASLETPIKIEVASNGATHEVLFSQDKKTFEPKLTLFANPETPFLVSHR